MHENFRLKGEESCYEDVEAHKVETILASSSEAKKTIVERSVTWQINTYPHKKNGFSVQNGPFACHFCGGIGRKYAKCWEREENARLQPEGWVSKMNKSVATVETDIIVGNVERFETLEFVEQNVVVKVADPGFDIFCTAIDLVDVVESEYELHGKACECDDLVKVTESEYV